uniref:Kazal-like domain-containing protein n=1 Tax=Anolis carolinensis TaxID=28377 RepID=A0A803TSP7_ANOCA
NSHCILPWAPIILISLTLFFFFDLLKFLRVEQDKDKECSLECTGSPQKSLCASDGRTFLSRCEFLRAKCKDPQLDIAYRGNCKGSSAEMVFWMDLSCVYVRLFFI